MIEEITISKDCISTSSKELHLLTSDKNQFSLYIAPIRLLFIFSISVIPVALI